MKNRTVQVRTDKELSRFVRYIHPTTQGLKRLSEAYEQLDYDNMRSAIDSMSTEPFIGNLTRVYDAEFRELLVEKILDLHGHKLPSKMRERQIKGDFKPRITPPKIKKKDLPKIKKLKPQKAKSGKLYRRTKMKKFTPQEVKFLKLNKKSNNKDMVKRFNVLFPGRTQSSIVSKKYRV